MSLDTLLTRAAKTAEKARTLESEIRQLVRELRELNEKAKEQA